MGCGSGHNLKMLSEFGEVFALEPDKQIAKYAQSENPNCKIIIGAMPDDNPLCDEKFDLIVSNIETTLLYIFILYVFFINFG